MNMEAEDSIATMDSIFHGKKEERRGDERSGEERRREERRDLNTQDQSGGASDLEGR